MCAGSVPWLLGGLASDIYTSRHLNWFETFIKVILKSKCVLRTAFFDPVQMSTSVHLVLFALTSVCFLPSKCFSF